MTRIVRCPRNDTSPREHIASSHRRSPLTRGHPRCGFTTATGKVARHRPRENKKKSHAAGCVDDSPLASRRILDAPDGCKPPSGLPVHSRVRLLLVGLVGGVGESRLAVVQRAPARGYGWSVSRKSVDRVGARVARRGARGLGARAAGDRGAWRLALRRVLARLPVREPTAPARPAGLCGHQRRHTSTRPPTASELGCCPCVPSMLNLCIDTSPERSGFNLFISMPPTDLFVVVGS